MNDLLLTLGTRAELEELFACELQVYRSCAFLVVGESCRMGSFLPEENTVSDIILLLGQLIREKVESGRYEPKEGEMLWLTEEEFRSLIEECKRRFGRGFVKTYREMLTEPFYQEVSSMLMRLELADRRQGEIVIRPALGRVIGRYPADYAEGDT